jgi:hypothetical protein
MVTIEDVRNAKNDSNSFLDIYQKIFFDKYKRPKVRLWLRKSGVNNNEIDDVESMMIITLIIGIDKYNHDKIPFEKWIWEKFRFTLNNYYFSKKHIKKYSNMIHMIDVYHFDDDKIEYEGKVIDIGYVAGNDSLLEFDFDIIVSKMNFIQQFICRCRFYNNWSIKEIKNYMMSVYNVGDKQFNSELKKAAEIFKLYFLGKI